jgi:hypothetical protein
MPEMDGMIQRAGYVQRSRSAATDETGTACRIVEFTVDGRQFGIREDELRRALTTWLSARVESLRHDWGPRLGGVVGYAERSRSGKAIVVELLTGQRFTVPAESLRAVLARSSAFAPVSEILIVPPLNRPAVRQQLLAVGTD